MAYRTNTFFSISYFRRVLNIVFFLFGDFPASKFYVPTFRNIVCSIFIGGVSKKNNQDEIVGLFIGKTFGSKIA